MSGLHFLHLQREPVVLCDRTNSSRNRKARSYALPLTLGKEPLPPIPKRFKKAKVH
jgi:hypothetical protein